MPGLLYGSQKLLVADGLEKEIESVHLVTFVGILFEGGGEDDPRGGRHLPREVETIEVGHLDIEEKEIDFQMVERLERLHGVVERGGQFKPLGTCDEVLQHLDGQGLVVYNHAFQCIHGFMVIVT